MLIAMAVVVALFGLGTTISLNVAERTREFGLLAVSASRAGGKPQPGRAGAASA